MRSNLMGNNVDAFVPDKDIIDELADGRRIQVAAAGVPIPRADAIRLGLVSPSSEGEKAFAAGAADSTEAAAEYNRRIAEKRGADPGENKATPLNEGAVVVSRTEEEPVKSEVTERAEKATRAAAKTKEK
jgi:hypothetical protein